MQTSYQKGISSEDISKQVLENKGYKILKQRYKTKYGEIDIIAKKENTICFIEVKQRKTDSFDSPVNKKQLLRISNTAEFFIAENNLVDKYDYRFDFILVIKSNPQSQAKFKHIQNAWRLDEIQSPEY